VATLRRANAFHRVCVASFSEARLIKVRRSAGEGLLTSMGVGAIARLWAHGRFARVFRNSQYQPVAQVPIRQGGLTIVDRRLIAIARRRGIEVHVWTVDDPAMMHRLLDLGVDGIMTDHPHVLKDVLRSRGVWA